MMPLLPKVSVGTKAEVSKLGAPAPLEHLEIVKENYRGVSGTGKKHGNLPSSLSNSSASESIVTSHGAHFSSSDLVLVLSHDSRIPGVARTIKREVGCQRTSAEQISLFSSMRKTIAVVSVKEWQPKSTNPNIARGSFATCQSEVSATMEVNTQSCPVIGDIDPKESSSKLQKKVEELRIIPNHLHVPGAEKLAFVSEVLMLLVWTRALRMFPLIITFHLLQKLIRVPRRRQIRLQAFKLSWKPLGKKVIMTIPGHLNMLHKYGHPVSMMNLQPKSKSINVFSLIGFSRC